MNILLLVILSLNILSNHLVIAKWNLQDFSNLVDTLNDDNNNKDDGPHYDKSSKTLHVPSFNAKTFRGHSLNFKGADIANAHLVNTTFDGYIPHLAISSLEVRSEIASASDGLRMATFDSRGSLSTSAGVKWNDRKETLHVDNLASHSSQSSVSFHSNIDMNMNTLSNFKIEKDSLFENVKIDSSIITDTKLVNASFDDLTIGSVNIDDLYISSISQPGSFPTVDEKGRIVAGSSLYESTNSLSVRKRVNFRESVDFNHNILENLQISSGRINSDEFDMDVRDIVTKSLTLDTFRTAKDYVRDTFVILKQDGSISSSDIVFEDGQIGDVKVFGIADFRGKHVEGEEYRVPGKIVGATVESGMVKDITQLTVAGPTYLGQNLDVSGDVLIDGGLTVGGSVLGSGPYVDVSDKRLKSNVKRLQNFFDSSKSIVQQLSKLQAVEYELMSNTPITTTTNTTTAETKKMRKREIGFIAQEVLEVFPALVSRRPDGFLGLQYSRFVPLLVEAIKSLQEQINYLENRA